MHFSRIFLDTFEHNWLEPNELNKKIKKKNN